MATLPEKNQQKQGVMTTSQNLAVALQQFLAAQESNGTAFPLKLFKPKEAPISQLAGRATQNSHGITNGAV